jgi:hypothetical protein
MEIGMSKQLTMDQIIKKQSYTPTYEDIFPKVRPLLIMINQALEDNIPKVKDFFEAQGKGIDRYLFPHLVRFYVKSHLETADLTIKMDEEEEPEADYQFERLVNNGLSGTYNGFRFRVLKADKGELPIPFSETKSKYYYQQLPLLPDLPLDSEFIRPNLVVLWEVNTKYDFYQLRLACPKSGYKTRDSVEAYFNEPVPHAAEVIKARKPNVIEEDIELVKKETESKVRIIDDLRRQDKTSP